jgi:thymidine kinase
MFAGKTTRLIERLEDARTAGQRVTAFKHLSDSRYDPRQLATHDGRTFPAVAVVDAAALANAVRATGVEVVGIDEAQFFGRALGDVCRRLVAEGRAVIAAGIHHDAWGQDFPPLPALAEVADEVETRCMPCGLCGAPAEYTQRMVPFTGATMIGGLGEYEPRCRTCFVPLPGPAPVY